MRMIRTWSAVLLLFFALSVGLTNAPDVVEAAGGNCQNPTSCSDSWDTCSREQDCTGKTCQNFANQITCPSRNGVQCQLEVQKASCSTSDTNECKLRIYDTKTKKYIVVNEYPSVTYDFEYRCKYVEKAEVQPNN